MTFAGVYMWMLFIRALLFCFTSFFFYTCQNVYNRGLSYRGTPTLIVREQLFISVLANVFLTPPQRRVCFKVTVPEAESSPSDDRAERQNLPNTYNKIKCESCNYIGLFTSQCCFVHFHLYFLFYFFVFCMLCCTGCYITNHIFLIYKINKTVCTESMFLWTKLKKDQTCFFFPPFL